MRRGAAWLAAVPLMLGGSQLAHAAAYRIAYPQAHVRLLHMLATGHSYFTRLPLVLAAAGACLLVSLAVTACDAARGRPMRALPAWAFALLPPLAFALQELLELSLHTGHIAWHAFAAPTFLPGLALQLPFALLAFLVTRLLLRVAAKVGRLLATRPDIPTVVRFWNDCDLLESRSRSRRAVPRAPPLAVGS